MIYFISNTILYMSEIIKEKRIRTEKQMLNDVKLKDRMKKLHEEAIQKVNKELIDLQDDLETLIIKEFPTSDDVLLKKKRGRPLKKVLVAI